MSEPKMIDELNDAELAKVKAAVNSGQLQVNELTCWYDDHLPCIGCRLNGVLLSIWWLSVGTAGAFYYPDSPKARDTIRTILADRIQQVEHDRAQE